MPYLRREVHPVYTLMPPGFSWHLTPHCTTSCRLTVTLESLSLTPTYAQFHYFLPVFGCFYFSTLWCSLSAPQVFMMVHSLSISLFLHVYSAIIDCLYWSNRCGFLKTVIPEAGCRTKREKRQQRTRHGPGLCNRVGEKGGSWRDSTRQGASNSWNGEHRAV